MSSDSPFSPLNSSKLCSANTIVEKIFLNCSTEHSSFYSKDDLTDSDDSSDGMQIVISDSPKKQKKTISVEDKLVLENLEEEIEKQLDEKAAKSNLTATNVKNILKHVISNEHVLAMVRHTVEDHSEKDGFVYEPKLTRAKVKELFEKRKVIIPWAKPVKKPISEVHFLINEELPEDSDDDEYVPQECESEDDRERSDIDSEPATPQTPCSMNDSATQTNWTEDGVFKIPPQPEIKVGEEVKEDENIALRTRSKLSLSDTPLEKIEEAFVPPDITTDMYDFECDDEDWRDFLKKFTRPLDEAVQGTQEDDDEADPEYNVLADEEREVVDQEELREDKAVKVTKKELNALVAELFDYNELFQTVTDEQITSGNQQMNNSILIENQEQIQEIEFVSSNDYVETAKTATIFSKEQMLLLQQQMRQHVQLATQHYLQTYRHPMLSKMAQNYKDYILTLTEMGRFKTVSAFHVANLKAAADLIERWEGEFASNDPNIVLMKNYVKNVIDTSINYRNRRNFEYIVTHAPYYLKTISESPVFMYPELIPKIPFKCDIVNYKNYYLPSENALIALGLEQFEEYAETDAFHKTKYGKMRLSDAAFYISKYIMPCRESKKIYFYIKQSNEKAAAINPIKDFLTNHKPLQTEHVVVPLEKQGMIPPCQRPPESLPHQLKIFLYPNLEIKNPPPVKAAEKKKKIWKKPEKPTYKPPEPPQTYLLLENYGQISAVPFEGKIPIPKLTKLVSKANEETNQCGENLNSVSTNIENDSSSDYIVRAGENEKSKGKRGKTKRTKSPNGNKSKKIKLDVKKTDDYIVQSGDDPKPEENTTEIEKRSKSTDTSENTKLNDGLCEKCQNGLNDAIRVDVKDKKCNLTSNKITSVILHNNHKDSEIKIFWDSSRDEKTLGPILTQLVNLARFRFRSETDENMLPSMPHLMTPMKFQNEEKNEETQENEISEEVSLDKKDNEEELNALMVASSTIQKCRKLPPSSTEKRKLKQKREYNATLAMLSPEDPAAEEEKAVNYAQAYHDKVQERLESDSPCVYQQFLEVLKDHDETTNTVKELYEKIESILHPKYPDLFEEFLTFLTPEQAKQIGKQLPHFTLSNMSMFLKKLEIYFSNQPAQLRKVLNSLTEVADNSDVQMDKVKSTILPLLKGNVLLINWFLQMFPNETPPEGLMTDWETIQCEDDTVVEDNDTYEYITIPDVEDPYGGPNCICKCHMINNEMYASRARHCIPCGTKFLQGRVYVQTGKGLRLANVTFNNNPSSDPYKRLSVQPAARPKRKSETSPSKNLMSPTKDEEPRHSNESEDDKDDSKKKPFRITSPKVRKRNRSTPKPTKKRPPKEIPLRKTTKVDLMGLKSEELDLKDYKEISVDDKSEICKIESETECDLKSPGHSTESLDTCEESSQDTIHQPNSDNDSDESIGEVESVSDGSEESGKDDDNDHSSWTRNEDKIILQMFQQHSDNELILSKIHELLSNRSITEIKQRFNILLSLLKKIKSASASIS